MSGFDTRRPEGRLREALDRVERAYERSKTGNPHNAEEQYRILLAFAQTVRIIVTDAKAAALSSTEEGDAPADDMATMEGRDEWRNPSPAPTDTRSLKERSENFNDTTGVISWNYRRAIDHPDACECQDQGVPHKHYPDPPYGCARCVCEAYVPRNAAPAPSEGSRKEMKMKYNEAMKEVLFYAETIQKFRRVALSDGPAGDRAHTRLKEALEVIEGGRGWCEGCCDHECTCPCHNENEVRGR